MPIGPNFFVTLDEIFKFIIKKQPVTATKDPNARLVEDQSVANIAKAYFNLGKKPASGKKSFVSRIISGAYEYLNPPNLSRMNDRKRVFAESVAHIENIDDILSIQQIYDKQINFYISKGSWSSYFTDKFCELVRMKPSKVELEIYNKQFDCSISKGWSPSYLIDSFYELVKIEKTDFLPKLIDVYSEVKNLSDNHQNAEAQFRDAYYWLHSNLKALLHLEDRYPAIQKFLLAQLRDRKNPALYTEEIAVFNQLDDNALKILDYIYKHKKAFYANDQRNFIKAARYLNCFFQFSKLVTEQEIKKLDSKPDTLFRFFGQILVDLLVVQFDIRINRDNFDIAEFEKNWDLDNFGTLLSVSDTWSAENKELFKTLVQAEFDGKLGKLFSDQVDQSADLNTQIIQKAFGQLKSAMLEHKLDFDKWQNAHKGIAVLKASRNSTSSTQAPYRELFEALNFSIAFTNQQSSNYIDLEIEVFNKDQLSADEKLAFNQLLDDVISTHYQQGNIPEAIADLQNYLNQKEDKRNTQYISIADPQDLGHNLFAGNRANSCTALGRNAKAILYLLSDPGTKYILVKNAEGNITGYARIFLTLDENNQAKIFIDSVDGSAHNFMPGIQKQLKKLAEEIGIIQEDFSYTRNSKMAKVKLGSSPFPRSYFHHAQSTMAI
ncbi:MAG: hypothetical protein LW817_05815 [Candidatus Caenarcaniphilales bacterium]|nr:hypothetical protein [Candidatus Caenarcaniphilales bacterium]